MTLIDVVAFNVLRISLLIYLTAIIINGIFPNKKVVELFQLLEKVASNYISSKRFAVVFKFWLWVETSNRI